jgi:hypothetical protein
VTWKVEFFEDDQGRQPAREWLQSLDSLKRASAIAAIEVVLTGLGLDVCGTEYGKQLGSGLFEFRIRHDEAVIRGKAGQDTDGERGQVLVADLLPRSWPADRALARWVRQGGRPLDTPTVARD